MTTEPQYRPREYLSISTLLSFARCPRKYFYQKCGIFPPDESAALCYGTAMHKAVSLALVEGYDPAIEAFISLWKPELSDTKRNIERAKAQLRHFVHTHEKGRSIYTLLPPPKQQVTPADGDVSPYEIVFMIDVGLPVPIGGRLDGWCQHRDTGDYYAFEFKTASRLGSSFFDSLEFNPQCLTYSLVTRTVTEMPIKGVMFEGMLIDPKKVDNLSHPVPVPDYLVEDCAAWLRYVGSLLLSCEERALSLIKAGQDAAAAFPKTFTGCTAYPLFYQSGSNCEYQNLCRVSEWKAMLPYYEIREEHKLVDLTRNET